MAINEIPEVVKLYLFCSPKLDLDYRCLPRAGGLMDQDWVTIRDFQMIEERIIQITNRRVKEEEAKIKKVTSRRR